MGSDNLTKELPDDGPCDRTTQPMMQELITEIRAMREKISGMESSVYVMGEKVSGMESSLYAMGEKISVMESESSNTREKISGMESKFDNVFLRFNAVDARLDQLETQVLRDIKSLGSRIGELRDTMYALNRRSLNTDRDVGRLQERLDELEGTKAT